MKKSIFRWIGFLLSVVLLCLPVAAFAATADEPEQECVVYVQDGGNGNGMTADAPVGTINAAVAAVNQQYQANPNLIRGRIVLTGNVTISSSYQETAHTIPIIYAALVKDDQHKFILGSNFKLGGPVMFTNLMMICTSGNEVNIYAFGHKLIMGIKGMNNDLITYDTTAGSTRRFGLVGGQNGATASVESIDVEVNSGAYQTMRIGSGASGGTVTGDVNWVINYATLNSNISIGGVTASNAILGKTNLIINGGVFTGKKIYVGCCNSGKTSTFGDRVFIQINGGTFSTGTYSGIEPYAGGTVDLQEGCIVDLSKYRGTLPLQDMIGLVDSTFQICDVSLVGYQDSYHDGAREYNLRLIATLNSFQHDAAGLDIVVKNKDDVVIKSFHQNVTAVYDSILGTTENGIVTRIDAEQIGGKYLLAVTLLGIPVEEQNLYFQVVPYTVDDDETIYGLTCEFTYCAGVNTNNERNIEWYPMATIMQQVLSQAETEKVSILGADNLYSAADVTGSGHCYYISADHGNDNNDGLSPQSAWQTISKLNHSTIPAGSVVLFERGGIYRGEREEIGDKTGLLYLKSNVIYSSYGEGDKPAIYGSPRDAAKEGTWSQTAYENVWVYSYPYSATDDIGNIIFNHGEVCGVKRIVGYTDTLTFSGDLADLDQNYHFWHDPDTGNVYLYYDGGNPGECFDSIELAVRINILRIYNNKTNVIVDNLCIKYGGAHGISASTSSNITITNCEIEWIGGGVYPGTKARYGNGIELNRDVDNAVIDHNYIWQVYDAGITHQFDSTNTTPCYHTNLKYINNVIEYCHYEIEYFEDPRYYQPTQEGYDPDNPTKLMDRYMANIEISGNYMFYAGYGWGTPQRASSGVPGSAFIKGWHRELPYVRINSDYPDGVQVKNNVMACSKYDMIVQTCTVDGQLPTFTNNVFIQYQGNRGFTLGAVNVAAGNREVWSETANESNPYLMNGGNTYYTIQ